MFRKMEIHMKIHMILMQSHSVKYFNSATLNHVAKMRCGHNKISLVVLSRNCQSPGFTPS